MPEREAFTTSATSAAPTRDPAMQDDPRAFVVEAARLLADSHCEDLMIFDVRDLSPVTKYILIATGTSDRQIKALGGHVSELGRELGFGRIGSEKDAAATWVVLDYVEVMVHLFEPVTRAHYDLELLWGDAPRVPWHRG